MSTPRPPQLESSDAEVMQNQTPDLTAVPVYTCTPVNTFALPSKQSRMVTYVLPSSTGVPLKVASADPRRRRCRLWVASTYGGIEGAWISNSQNGCASAASTSDPANGYLGAAGAVFLSNSFSTPNILEITSMDEVWAIGYMGAGADPLNLCVINESWAY